MDVMLLAWYLSYWLWLGLYVLITRRRFYTSALSVLILDFTSLFGASITPRVLWYWARSTLLMTVSLLYGFWVSLLSCLAKRFGFTHSLRFGTLNSHQIFVSLTSFYFHQYVIYENYWFLVQIWSLLNLSKNNFTKDYKGALFDLLHVLLIIISLICIIEYSDLYQRYFYEVYLSLTIMFVRNIIYMQLCVTAEMKYNQFQPSTLLFVIGYPCNFLVIFSVHFYFFKNGSLFNYFYLLITCFYCCRFCILCD